MGKDLYMRRLIIIVSIMMLVLFGLYREYLLRVGKEKPSDTTSVSTYPHDMFFSNLAAYYRLLLRIQAKVDTAAISRDVVTGTIAWYPCQIYYYARVVSSSRIKNVCELGYGAGHSALLYLTMNSKITLHSFDLFPEPSETVLIPNTTPRQGWYQNVTLNYIRSIKDLSVRFNQIVGNSHVTVPKFAHEHPDLKCDLISIDGSHESPQVYFDILHFKKLATNETYVMLDDVDDTRVRKDIDRAIAENLLSEYECLVPEQRHDENFRVYKILKKVFCTAHYLL